MKAEIVNSFIASTIEAFRTLAGIEPRRGDARLKRRDEMSYDVSGVVGISGQIKGSINLSFRKSAALRVVEGFLGERIGRVDDQVVDAVGELANIVAGGAKRVLSEAGYDLKISIPTVIVGEHHMISRPKDVPCLEVPFDLDAGPFAVELCLASAL
ncbi:MAG: chemotaxis protein CheX [Deltaproteobacteria bacterium]|nr:chemotaxis protein CheX [Deltaproteobacteria bacterium]